MLVDRIWIRAKDSVSTSPQALLRRSWHSLDTNIKTKMEILAYIVNPTPDGIFDARTKYDFILFGWVI